MLTSEYVLLSGLLVFGIAPGLIATRDAHNRVLARHVAAIESVAVPQEEWPAVGLPDARARYQRVETVRVMYVEQAP